MSDTPESLAERLKQEGERVISFFNNLSQPQWGLIIYPQGAEWTFKHLLAHIVSSEIGRSELIQDILMDGLGAPKDFDIEAYNQREVDGLLSETSANLIKRFTLERSKLVNVVLTMKQADLDRIGNDPFLGEAQLVDIIKLTYRHHIIHLRDAKRILSI